MSKKLLSILKLGVAAVAMLVGIGTSSITSKAAFDAPYYNITVNGGNFDGTRYVLDDGTVVKDAFFCDGTYTYFLQADGTPMKDRLTYHPDGEHIIYFDEYGHEVFDNFANVKKSIAGQPVDDLCYFNTFGYMYVDVLTYDVAGINLYYANPYGVMERNGLFEFSDGYRGFANSDGKLVKDTFFQAPDGNTYYFAGDGKAAKGIITDLTNYYYLAKRDGHLMGTFATRKEAEEMSANDVLNIEYATSVQYCEVNTLLSLVSGSDSHLVRWTSSNNDIVTVINNQPIAMSPGEVTLIASAGGETYDIEVEVWPIVYTLGLAEEEITLFEGESFQIGLGGTTIAEWSVANSDIATVSEEGLVTAKELGETVVSATYAGETVKCTVKVVEDDGSYYDVLNVYDYKATAKKTVKEYERFYLITDGGICLPDDFVDRVNTVMKAIEEETGYSFYPSGAQKIVIAILNNGMGGWAYASSDQVVLAAMDTMVEDFHGPQVLLHEMLHVVQGRNSGELGQALTEGFAEYHVENILPKLPYPFLYNELSNQWSSYVAAYGDTLNEDNMRDALINPEDPHPTSYFFTKYLIETYGKDTYNKIINNIPQGVTEEEKFVKIEECTSVNVAKDFATWMKAQERPNDFTHHVEENATVYIYPCDNKYVNVLFMSDIRYTGKVVVDYTPAIEYYQKVRGQKIRTEKAGPFNTWLGGDDISTVKFYDAKGKLIKEGSLGEDYPPKAVKAVVTGGDYLVVGISA